MLRIIAVLNFKGGTAKTATVVNLGMGLALRGHRVLAMDLDPQGSVAGWLGIPFENTTADLLLGRANWRQCVVQARPRFDIIPSNRELAVAERTLTQKMSGPDILRSRMDGIEDSGYEFILLDCAPAIDLISEAALNFAQEVFVPVSMEYLAMVGVRMVLVEVLRARRLTAGKSARVSLVIPTFFDPRYDKSAETLKLLQDNFPGMVTAPIRFSEQLSEAPSHQRTIFEYDIVGTGSIDYGRLVERVAGDHAGPPSGSGTASKRGGAPPRKGR